jgi:polysaccharide biosynthesis transport protein
MYDQPQGDVNVDRNDLMELSDYLKAFRERWLLILLATLIGAGIGGVITQRITPVYTGEAMLFLKVDPSAGPLYERSQFGLQRVKSYPSVVQSPHVLLPVISELQLGVTLADLQSRVTATNPTNTVFLKVQADDSSPERAAAIANAVSKNLASEVAALEAAKGGAASAISLVPTVPASPPTNRTSPSFQLNGALGALIGLALGLSTAVIWKRVDQRVRTAEDVRAVSGLPLLGQLTRRPARRGLQRPHKLDGQVEATYQELRNSLQRVAGGTLPSVLILVSALHKHKEPNLRFEVASSLAQTGRIVCLLEADFSAGSAHEAGDGTATPGVAGVLSEHCDVSDALVTSSDGHFQVLPAGPKGAAPVEFLAQSRFPTVAKKLRESFDVVIAQASPVSEPVNLAMVAPCADGAVLIVEYAKTGKRELTRLLAEVKSCGLRPLGVVMTSVPSHRRVPVADGWRSGDFRNPDLALEPRRVNEYR